MGLRFTFQLMLRDYIEITRLFNMGLTGVAPVLGALSMWDVGIVITLEIDYFIYHRVSCPHLRICSQ